MNVFQYLILNKKDYFSLAEEYIGLQTTFQKESILEKLSFNCRYVNLSTYKYLYDSFL